MSSRKKPNYLEGIVYDAARRDYWLEMPGGDWLPVTETSMRRHLKARGFSPKPAEGFLLSKLDEALNTIQRDAAVAYAGALAGYRRGVHHVVGRRILVTSAPALIEAKEGTWDTLASVLRILETPECDQRPYLYGWIKCALEALNSGTRRPGQALALAGPRDCGKSLLQNLITLILGGRTAKPYLFMTGATTFNSELFGAEHLAIEDEAASTDIRARRAFGSAIKGFSVNETQNCHAKGREALTLSPFWRVTISVNDEPEHLSVLPPIDESVEDKIQLLRVVPPPEPFNDGSPDGRTAFWSKLVSELPAFVSYLGAWTIPPSMRSSRFGVLHYHHPALLQALDDLAPETRLWHLIQTELLDGLPEWKGTARALEKILTDSDSSTVFEARRLFGFNTACGVYLARLERKRPGQVVGTRTADERLWTLRRMTG